MAKRKRRAFTREFKAEAVRLVRESGKSVPNARARTSGRTSERWGTGSERASAPAAGVKRDGQHAGVEHCDHGADCDEDCAPPRKTAPRLPIRRDLRLENRKDGE